jgi:hypothetical protein
MFSAFKKKKKKHIPNTFNTHGLNLPPNPRKKMMMSFSVWLPLKHIALTISNTRAAKLSELLDLLGTMLNIKCTNY